ncbi:MAG TPA: DUF4136 domain-containing protein [Candidatus Angelobacter sp.]
MKIVRSFLPTILAVLVFTVAGRAFDDVQTDYDKKADFSHYRTYSWEKVQTSNPLWEQRIKDAVDAELQAKGLQKVDSGGDVALMAVGATHNEQEYQTFYTGLGPRWWWRGFGPVDTTTTVQTYRIGTLVLDMYDAQNHRLIWRGTASDMLSDKPSKNEKKLDKTIAKMFDKFPPKGNKE